MKSSIISVGDSFRIFGSEVNTYTKLPVATYTVEFNPMMGFSLLKVDDLEVGIDKVYGHRDDKVDKVLRGYNATGRSLGLMLSGDKGQGKSLFLRMLAEKAVESNLPVVRVTIDVDGIADFIDSLGECMVVFDEFEKVFSKSGASRGMDPEGGGGGNRQDQFLSLFDGVSSTKRLYCITLNDVRRVSDYLLNRPGRFHYHIRFDYPGQEQIREYMTDQVPDITDDQIASIITLSNYTNLNYDHLQAIAFELTMHDYDADVSEIVEDLNIKPTESVNFIYTVFFKNGQTVEEVSGSPFGGSDRKRFYAEDKDLYARLSFSPNSIEFSKKTGRMTVAGKDVKADMDAEEIEKFGEVTRIEISPEGQGQYTYGAY